MLDIEDFREDAFVGADATGQPIILRDAEDSLSERLGQLSVVWMPNYTDGPFPTFRNKLTPIK
ncbi:hypothetical protein Mucpa_1800 [Mucilaginibacter paludis DSM 18603]|uniref:Uncharacterized protein n=1 Tax=Mucilaginibacter paludis DSM 18603 TaxID=714943 RepID=H1YA73_9SPHI|nr:hypothetical protein Mucpa_1800 [Mucilaginibacter paludis DSM 18603]